MKKICIVTTMWSSINNWIAPFLNDYHNNGIDVTIVCNMDEDFISEIKSKFPFIHTFPIDFPRGMSVGGSIKSILTLKRFLKKEKFDLIQYSTPNASFYSAIASRLAKIPVRLYCQWGMVYVTKNGVARSALKMFEKTTCYLSTIIQPDSKGNLDFCRKNKLYDENKSYVIWNGSAKGIDLEQYDIAKKEEYAKEIKQKYNLDNSYVLGFVGRLGREKGCNELFTAFRNLKKKHSNLKLLFIGPIEKENTINPELLEFFRNCDDIIKTGRISDVQKHMSAMDLFILPSYREGFGMSVVEASAMEVPVIATKYPGPSCAMIDGKTGYEIEVASVDDIEEKIEYLISNPEIAISMGKNGRNFVKNNFEQKKFREIYITDRKKLLGLYN